MPPHPCPFGIGDFLKGNIMQVGAAAAILTQVGVVAIEAALVATAVLALGAGMWGFKAIKKAF